jgi:hypothetical protein
MATRVNFQSLSVACTASLFHVRTHPPLILASFALPFFPLSPLPLPLSLCAQQPYEEMAKQDKLRWTTENEAYLAGMRQRLQQSSGAGSGVNIDLAAASAAAAVVAAMQKKK